MEPTCICAGLACYRCGWRGDPRTGEQGREPAIGEAIQNEVMRLRGEVAWLRRHLKAIRKALFDETTSVADLRRMTANALRLP